MGANSVAVFLELGALKLPWGKRSLEGSASITEINRARPPVALGQGVRGMLQPLKGDRHERGRGTFLLISFSHTFLR